MHDLQRLFRIAAEQFPGMMYVAIGSMERDGAKGVFLDQSLLPADLRYNDDDLIESWTDQGYEYGEGQVREPRKSWLARMPPQNWNKAVALDTLRSLSAKTLPHLSSVCYDESLLLPDPAILKIRDELYHNQDAVFLWLRAICQFRESESQVAPWAKSLFRMGSRTFYYSYIGDTFQASFLACSQLISEMESPLRLPDETKRTAVEQSQVGRQKAKRKPRRRRDQTASKQARRRFELWAKPGDACFVIDGARTKFHLDSVVKDLRLKSGSRAEVLLHLLTGGVLTRDEVKKNICTANTKPSEAIRDVNRLLNRKIMSLGFTAVPADTAFIGCDPQTGQYFCHLPIRTQDEIAWQ